MIRAYLLDDEQLAIDRLTRLLHETGRVTIVGSSIDPVTALAELERTDAELLFLDIQMPALTGFDVVERLPRDIPIIFITAFDQYALDAFAVNSIDYLLKPVEPERLARALDKHDRLIGQARPDVKALARELAAQLSPARKLDRIASRVGDRTTLVDVTRITHLVAKDKLTFAIADGREHVVDFTLHQLEQRLDPRRFLRIHRATIVNLPFVQELHGDVDSGVIVRLKDEKRTELSVARDRVRELKEKLGI
jgi:two-component system, LytTR family, response regulator